MGSSWQDRPWTQELPEALEAAPTTPEPTTLPSVAETWGHLAAITLSGAAFVSQQQNKDLMAGKTKNTYVCSFMQKCTGPKTKQGLVQLHRGTKLGHGWPDNT